MATTMILAMCHTENDAESELCMSMHHPLSIQHNLNNCANAFLWYKCHSYMNLVKCINQFTEISCKL